MKKKPTTDQTNWYLITKIFIFGVVIYNVISYLFFPTYVGFKCDYRTANFGLSSLSIIKEFNGDPCMKDGKNRFKLISKIKPDIKDPAERFDILEPRPEEEKETTEERTRGQVNNLFDFPLGP